MKTQIQTIVTEILNTGITQSQLADLVPCAQSTISAYFIGQRGKRPSMQSGTRLMHLHAKLTKVSSKKRDALLASELKSISK